LITKAADLGVQNEILLVYSNPFTYSVTVTMKTSKNYNLKVRNTLGQKVLKQIFNDKSCTDLLDSLNPCVYFIAFKNNAGYWADNFVKE